MEESFELLIINISSRYNTPKIVLMLFRFAPQSSSHPPVPRLSNNKINSNLSLSISSISILPQNIVADSGFKSIKFWADSGR